ncbi:FkbM family methyltransferase [Tabrizicola oligotrophica]|uniref:FkbM family methyltransferase n=1 Tax=Tabrizicola oligotrophica TaxID=2710650 RepID=A0A6M0QQW2_9RHOB|nr:FkbM family methyltransferase [Tabrizicola oligotrophica]NEY89848.1 FkbM family methyltransferase [Tabrizicola oligotrophica]
MATRHRPPPASPAQLIARRLPDWRADVVFDVGANVGQSAREFAQGWPDARIHSFEPVPRSFARLCEATRDLSLVTAHNLGLGRHSGAAEMTDLANSVQNRIVAEPAAAAEATTTQTVQILRGADFCDSHGIRRISYLKIDTEGHDLEVLKGFGALLKWVDFVQVEAGMNPYNKTHVPFEALSSFLTRRGFLLFYLFEQMMEFKLGGRPVLRRCNPVFINDRLVDLAGIA